MTAIEALKEKGITPRRVILDLVNHIAIDYPKRITEEEKVLKIVLWHIGLEDTSQEEIMVGLKSLLNNPSEFPPNCGKFKSGCTLQPKYKIFSPEIELQLTPEQIKETKKSRKNFFNKLKGIC